jgi:NAD(P)-dependent dehydrogenase (short-subunit alcohol dehydrogenase family)
LGTAFSLALAQAGADIVVTDFRPADGERARDQVLALGKKSVFFPADITKSEEVNYMMSKSIAQWGKVDILVNCAGVVREQSSDASVRPLWEITDQEWHLGIDTNLSGAFFATRSVIKHMVDRKQGNIINIASGFGLRGRSNGWMYCCAKAGVVLLTSCLAMTFGKEGIRSNCIAPGLFRTWGRQELYNKRGNLLPAGRVGEPHEIASLAVYLASDASKYVTGEVFAADGGTLAGGIAPTGVIPNFPFEF